MTSPNIVRLGESRLDEVSHVLSRAFFNDPLQGYTFPDPEERIRHSPAHFAAIARYGHLTGELWGTEGRLDGVAIWCQLRNTEFSETVLEESGLNALPTVIGAGPFNRFSEAIDHVEIFHRRDMPQLHWYLMVIGVEPHCQGSGIGGALLQPMLQRAGATGIPCYLETFQPRNVPFYSKHGFDCVVEGVEPKSGLPFWTFRRTAVQS